MMGYWQSSNINNKQKLNVDTARCDRIVRRDNNIAVAVDSITSKRQTPTPNLIP